MIDTYKISRRMNEVGLTQEVLADRIGITRKTLNTYFAKGVVSKERLLEPMAVELGVNVEFLLKKPTPYANGDTQEARSLTIVNEEVSKTWSGSEFRELSDDRLLMTIPLVDEFAYAGYLSGWKDPEFIEDLPRHSIVVPKRHTGCYRAFAVKGDSMDNDRRDAICAEDVVVGRSIDKHFWNAKFHLNKFRDYVVVHQDGILIKRIVSHDVEEGIISCSSINPDKTAYPDFDVKLADVYEIYNIVSVERKRKI